MAVHKPNSLPMGLIWAFISYSRAPYIAQHLTHQEGRPWVPERYRPRLPQAWLEPWCTSPSTRRSSTGAGGASSASPCCGRAESPSSLRFSRTWTRSTGSRCWSSWPVRLFSKCWTSKWGKTLLRPFPLENNFHVKPRLLTLLSSDQYVGIGGTWRILMQARFKSYLRPGYFLLWLHGKTGNHLKNGLTVCPYLGIIKSNYRLEINPSVT